MSQPADDEWTSVTPSEDAGPAADRRPPAYGSPYGQPPGAPPSPYGQGGQGAPPYGQSAPYGQNAPYGYGGHAGQAPEGQGPYAGQWGYGPPGNPGGPRTGPVGDDTTWALFCYLGTLVGGFIAPLVIYFVKRNESVFVRHHAAQMLNYTLTMLIQLFGVLALVILIAIVAESPVVLIALIPLIIVHVIAQYVFLIIGSIKASKGEWYRIPAWTCWRMIR